MARPLRLCFENAVYHITARGNRRENIFYSDRDRYVFLDKMNETFVKYSFICYAHCLIENHYHLVLKTPNANISEGMHYLNTSYANWFKAKHNIVGVVFQGRYKSPIVDEDNYALVATVYVHVNPIRAGVVKNLEDYKWSSFLDYIGKRKPIVERLDTSFILNKFGKDLRIAQENYRNYVLENIGMKNPFENLYKGIALGDKVFIENVEKRIRSIGQKREIGETRFKESYGAEEIINKISETFEIKKGKIFSKQKGNILRQLALYLIKKKSNLSLKEVGVLFDMDYTAVSQASRRFENKIKSDKKVLNMKNKVIETLTKS
ncbi:MAG: chromosomal replication initiator DnaA [Candidatus Cloacimonadota bacterium]|nr:MAG: chromosomal replication initiator DnaA [Candidatus Cloacimonadota bacterium]